MLIYRLDLAEPPQKKSLPEGRCIIVKDLGDVLTNFTTWLRNWGIGAAIKTALKVLSGKRVLFYSVVDGGKIVQSGWANLGFCKYYPVEDKSVVLGTLYVVPEFRSRGYSTSSKTHVIEHLYQRGYKRFYSDTTPANRASQRTSEKLGFVRVA